MPEKLAWAATIPVRCKLAECICSKSVGDRSARCLPCIQPSVREPSATAPASRFAGEPAQELSNSLELLVNRELVPRRGTPSNFNRSLSSANSERNAMQMQKPRAIQPLTDTAANTPSCLGRGARFRAARRTYNGSRLDE